MTAVDRPARPDTPAGALGLAADEGTNTRGCLVVACRPGWWLVELSRPYSIVLVDTVRGQVWHVAFTKPNHPRGRWQAEAPPDWSARGPTLVVAIQNLAAKLDKP